LIENGAEITIEDKFGQNCLFYAIREGHSEVVEYLINRTDKLLDMPDKKGLTPYMFAMKNGKTKIAEILKEYGFRTEMVSNDKKSKNKKKIPITTKEVSKTEEEPKFKQYVLIRVNENGEKMALSPNEIEQFAKEYPEIWDLLNSPAALEDIENEAPEE
jgi:ankyrin repeat protein